MGLDITAYEQVIYLRPYDPNHDTQIDYKTETLLYVNQELPQQSDGMLTGIYEFRGKPFCFRAGSYSGYNLWRYKLARLGGRTPEKIWQNPQPGPFVELINYSDCEGLIGPQTAAKLYRDFQICQQAATTFGRGLDHEDWCLRYNSWMTACHLASKEGAISLH